MEQIGPSLPTPGVEGKRKRGFLEMVKRWWENRGFRAFCLGFLIALCFFLPYLIFDKGYFLFYGDFNVQQIPFYQTVHDAVRNGDLWSWNTDLGANLIGSYTFYNLTSPFFWLTLPFPSETVPYLMGPLLILKFSCASLTAYIYLKRYVKSGDIAVIGGLLYAFSGFSVYNIFFNHFHEAIIIFPLMLAALDSYMYERKRGIFALAVFASCFMNYYFFAGQVVFCLIYWFLRMGSGSWKISVKDFLWLAFEAVIGVAMTAVMILPTILAVLQNGRVNSPTYGWGALVYSHEQRYLHILQSLFFPPDIPARPNFTPDSDAKWASLGAWLPLFSMTGVIAWIQTKKKNWIKRMVILLLFMTVIPILNNSFQLFNAAYYARWFYMMTLMMALATVCCLETEGVNWGRALRWTGGITAAMALGIGLMPKQLDAEGNIQSVGLEDYPHRFWPYVAISLWCLLLLYYLLPLLRKNKRKFMKFATLGVALVSAIYSMYYIGLGKTQSYDDHNFIIPYALNGGKDVSLPDQEGDGDYRVDFYSSMDNMAMFWHMPSIQAFHSIVPGSIMEFYNSVGVERGVASRPETSHIGIRGLLSVKYLFDYAGDSDSFITGEEQEPQIPGFRYYATQNGFDIYENEYYIPFGFTYDKYCNTSQYEAVSQQEREIFLLDAILLSNEQILKYGDLMDPVMETEPYYGEEAYLEYCAQRRQETCDTFEMDGRGFTATIDLSKENLVFFSVPWEEGWSATVDGEPVEIEKVNVGFMAVPVGEGEHTIRFEYQTPGLSAGFIITIVSAVIFVVALLVIHQFDMGKWEWKSRKKAAVTQQEEEK